MPLKKDLNSILIIGSGPIIIGQACEFDYSGSQALRSLKEDGIETVLINSNPATIMTDPVMADHIYLLPLNTKSIKKILKKHHLQCPELLDYQIRIPRGGQTDALTESIITWNMNGKKVQTVGIDSDQVMAAVNSTLKMMNLHLMQLDNISESAEVETAA